MAQAGLAYSPVGRLILAKY
ncbi:uncharacterized protein G2W53_024536 [Senna tora]|uniref:Uncharacterized protein n=1 Tax=Senna tora TaxID=362788 RepID=A0A834WH14_9FABA|nr:uncharacterized protein G2W53_024536 [Senna tora]